MSQTERHAPFLLRSRRIRTNGTKDLLDHLYDSRPGSRFHSADLVGPFFRHSHWLCELVGRLSERVVRGLAVKSGRRRCDQFCQKLRSQPLLQFEAKLKDASSSSDVPYCSLAVQIHPVGADSNFSAHGNAPCNLNA